MDIKFKAKSKKDGEWVYGYYVVGHHQGKVIHKIFNDLSPNDELGYWTEVDGNTVCQYIGIQDSEGHDIYEHDYIHVECMDFPRYRFFEVFYSKKELQFLFHNYEDGDLWFSDMQYYEFKETSKVIGNRYDETTTSEEDNQ